MSEPQNEIDLMRRTAAGDAVAFRSLADAHLVKIMNYAFRMLHDRAEAEDVAQETFLRLWKDAARYEPRARVSTWLHSIAHNLCIDRLRRKREQPAETVDGELSNDEAPRSQQPSELLASKRTAVSVERALASLPDRQRAAITLIHYQGLSSVDASAVLGIGPEALESLLSRGRRKLRELLGGLATEGESS